MREATYEVDGIVPMRILAPSPLCGGLHQFEGIDLLGGPETRTPSVVPQGPPLLEDAERNPEAAALCDISLGQIGKDLQGHSFQLIRTSGEAVPRKILLRCLDTEETFWIDTNKEPSVLADTVSYGELPEDQLLRWRGSLEAAVWEMRDHGLWDMQIQDRRGTWTLIGNWILHEVPRVPWGRRRDGAKRYSNAAQACWEMDQHARDVEIYPLIKSYADDLDRGVSPRIEDATDRIRHSVRLGLLGRVHPMHVASDLYSAAQQQQSRDLQSSLASLAAGVLSLGDTSIEDDDGIDKIAPLWRRISLLRLEN